MSADARVARAIQQIREIDHMRRLDPHPAAPPWLDEYLTAVDDLIAEVTDALHLTDDINRY